MAMPPAITVAEVKAELESAPESGREVADLGLIVTGGAGAGP